MRFIYFAEIIETIEETGIETEIVEIAIMTMIITGQVKDRLLDTLSEMKKKIYIVDIMPKTKTCKYILKNNCAGKL